MVKWYGMLSSRRNWRRAFTSVANSWQKILARFTKKFGRWRKNSAAHNYLIKRLIILSLTKIPAATEEGKFFLIVV
jgi:hypothetical protein